MTDDDDEQRREWPKPRGLITVAEHREHVADGVFSLGCVFCLIVKR